MTITLWGRLTLVQCAEGRLGARASSGSPTSTSRSAAGSAAINDPAYLAMNPNGLVPTLRDGDLVALGEPRDRALPRARPMARAACGPIDPRERAIVDQWTDWTATTFQPAWIGVFWQLVRTPEAEHESRGDRQGDRRDSRPCFGIMDAAAGEAPYLGGDG